MSRHRNHHSLVKVGLGLHESRRYGRALGVFEEAQRLAPSCPVVAYNRANTMHLLGRDEESRAILRDLVSVAPETLERRCDAVGGRSLQLDAYFLLFLVTLHCRGFSDEAFGYADEHLRSRCRGLHSVWTLREVRAEVSAMRREWNLERQVASQG
jgi:tetratricopeptide (TPR) repeat protein